MTMQVPPATGHDGGTNSNTTWVCCYGPTCKGKTVWGWNWNEQVPADFNADDLLRWYSQTSPHSPCASGTGCPWSAGGAGMGAIK